MTGTIAVISLFIPLLADPPPETASSLAPSPEIPDPIHSEAPAPPESRPRAVPAEFVSRLTLPGQSDDFLRPSAIFVDRNADEVLVADTGHNRIVVLDPFGTYKYEFLGQGHFSTPRDVDVDSQGHIYVLGSTRSGHKVFLFDFDGLFLQELNIGTPDGPVSEIASMALDDSDNLFLIDRARVRVCCYDRLGRYQRSFPLIPSIGADERREQILGSMVVSGDTIFIPVPTLGTVFLYSRNGDLIRTIGHQGNNVGELSFPVSVAMGENILMVLDKHRFNVVCFTLDGRFLGEFGGKGISPGWFYHPTLLAADKQNQVYVGQAFQSKIQVCRIPGFIAAGGCSTTQRPNI